MIFSFRASLSVWFALLRLFRVSVLAASGPWSCPGCCIFIIFHWEHPAPHHLSIDTGWAAPMLPGAIAKYGRYCDRSCEPAILQMVKHRQLPNLCIDNVGDQLRGGIEPTRCLNWITQAWAPISSVKNGPLNVFSCYGTTPSWRATTTGLFASASASPVNGWPTNAVKNNQEKILSNILVNK